jgi:hypothetical protein
LLTFFSFFYIAALANVYLDLFSRGTPNSEMDSFEFEIKSNVVNSNSQPYFEKHYHNSTFHTFPHNNLNNGNATIATTTGSTSSFSTYQQHPLSSFHTNSSTMPPPLIHYNQQSQHQSVTHQQNQQAASNSSKLGDSQQTLTNSVAESAVSKVNEENSHPLEDQLVEQPPEEATEEAEEPEIDIVINNVVCAFNVRCTLALKEIALHGANVEYKRENGMVTMKLRKPYTTASIWSSGMDF